MLFGDMRIQNYLATSRRAIFRLPYHAISRQPETLFAHFQAAYARSNTPIASTWLVCGNKFIIPAVVKR